MKVKYLLYINHLVDHFKVGINTNSLMYKGRRKESSRKEKLKVPG